MMKLFISDSLRYALLAALIGLGCLVEAQTIEPVFEKRDETVMSMFQDGEHLYLKCIVDSLTTGALETQGILYGKKKGDPTFSKIADWQDGNALNLAVDVVKHPGHQSSVMAFSDHKAEATYLYKLTGLKKELLTDKLPAAYYTRVFCGEKIAYVVLIQHSGRFSVWSYNLNTAELEDTELKGYNSTVYGLVIKDKLFLCQNSVLHVSEGSPSTSQTLGLQNTTGEMVKYSYGIYPMGNGIIISTDTLSFSNGMMVSDGTQAGTTALKLDSLASTKTVVLGKHRDKLALLARNSGNSYVYLTDGTNSGTSKAAQVPELSPRDYASLGDDGLAYWDNWGKVVFIDEQNGNIAKLISGLKFGMHRVAASSHRIFAMRLELNADSVFLQSFKPGDTAFSTPIITSMRRNGLDAYSLASFNSAPYLMLPTKNSLSAVLKPDINFASIPKIMHAELKVYPNPSTGMVTLSWPESFKASRIVVYNSSGQMVHERQIMGQSTATLSLEREPKGIYLIKAISLGGSLSHKVLKQ